MTSFITTMFVPSSPSLASLISPPKPLEPVFTLSESSSCIRLPSSSSVHSLYEVASSTPPPSTAREKYTPEQYRQSPRQSQEQLRPTSPVKRFLNAAFNREQQSPSPTRGPGPQEISPGAHNLSHLRMSNTIDDLLSSNSRTRSGAPFRPQNASRGTTSWQLKQFAEATLGSGSLRKAVKLPEGEDENEWLAVNSTFPQPVPGHLY